MCTCKINVKYYVHYYNLTIYYVILLPLSLLSLNISHALRQVQEFIYAPYPPGAVSFSHFSAHTHTAMKKKIEFLNFLFHILHNQGQS